ncbi:unnamed protein product [Rotaria sp. Silwood1]|nr:unnamed protein product [Rotaria sp. Silwood1]CAF1626566.1 unnamed protein product [Rotaria sp. Silwood1]CAF3744208.1 unnamed protein product [Rotaria sp. Silwood1]CAF4873919.1 unnamed protein product [Rotaria sp. Silwood1]CAF4878608.1 unnamed protein product [Rotaria sp. Silwood1]
MESFSNTQSSSDLLLKTIIISKDDEDIVSNSDEKKIKPRRKTSKNSGRTDEKTKSRTSKHRLSLAPTNRDRSGSEHSSRSSNGKSSDGGNSSALEELTTERPNNDYELEKNLQKLPRDKKKSNQKSKKTKDSNSQKPKQAEDNVEVTLEEQFIFLQHEYQKNESLEEKLAENHEFDNMGIMNLSAMNLTDTDMPLIIQRALQKKTKCTGILLRDNGLTSLGVKILVDALLATPKKLKYLSFSNNTAIGDVGVQHLIRLLKANRSITFLALPNTGMTDQSVRLLADVLGDTDGDSSCSPLEKLHISFNKSITDESLAALTQILERNKTLKEFAIQHCSLSEEARYQLRQTITGTKKKKLSLTE